MGPQKITSSAKLFVILFKSIRQGLCRSLLVSVVLKLPGDRMYKSLMKEDLNLILNSYYLFESYDYTGIIK